MVAILVIDDEQCTKDNFYKIVKDTIDEDDWLKSFENLWIEKQYRQAYGLFLEHNKEYKVTLSAENIEADKKFYWLFVN